MRIGLALAAIVILSTPYAATGGPLTEEQKIVHVLNRLGFGPRPGDVERVRKFGLKAYLDQQLNPASIKDDAVDAKTAGFDALRMAGPEIAAMERAVQMSNRQLQMLQRAMAERGAMEGSDAIQGAVNAAQTGVTPTPAQQVRAAVNVFQSATPEERKLLEEGRAARLKVNAAGTELVMNKLIRAVESERQLYEVMVDFWSNHFNIDASKVRASKVIDEQQVIRPHAMGKFRDLLNASSTSAAMMIYLDNAQSTAPRAVPQRPLAGQPGARITLERVRQAAGRGQPAAVQMLERVAERAKSDGISEEEAFRKVAPALVRQPARARGGLNENYARELMELHTLGVDGGYTQKDVTELARCLTGWGVRGGRYSGEFEFHPSLHDQGEKVVLGKTIPAGGGMEDGKIVLEMLATHPSTMRYISTKLCRRLVSDDPPKSLVDRCVETWKKSDGDIREIVRTIVESKEFFSPAAVKTKIKSPFEYAVSSVRALGATLEPQSPAPGRGARPAAGGINVFAGNGNGQTNTRVLAGQIGSLGQPLFNHGFPTGYPEHSTKWVSSGALIGRINFALSLVNGRIADVSLDRAALSTPGVPAKSLEERVDAISRKLLGGPLTAGTRSTLLKQLAATTPLAADRISTQDDSMEDSVKIAALVLGSPEFQRR